MNTLTAGLERARVSQPRDRGGRFDGHDRINTETTPCLPASCGRLAVDHPTRGPLLALWLDPSDRRSVAYLCILEVSSDLTDAVKVSALAQPATTVRLIRHPRPQGPCPLWRCPRCGRPCTAMYLFGHGTGDAPSLGVGCYLCQRLHYASRSAPVTRTKILRSLLGITHSERIPRTPLVPDRLVHGARALKALRLRNLQVQAIEAGVELAVAVTPWVTP